MSIQTCIAGRNFPARELLRKIAQGRGHQVIEATNPARCFIPPRPGEKASATCKIIVAEYVGEETADMIDFSIERSRVPAKNIAILVNGTERGVRDVQELGCKILRQPLQAAELVEWVVAAERRCR